MGNERIISAIRGVTSGGNSTKLVLVMDSSGSLFLRSIDHNRYVRASYKFSKENFKEFFGKAIKRSYNIDREILGVRQGLDYETKVNLVEDLVQTLDEVDICKEKDRKPDYVNTKRDVLRFIERYFNRGNFTAREFKRYYPWNDTSSQRWLQRLKNQGFLRIREAEAEDGRVKYEYRLSEKGLSYLDMR